MSFARATMPSMEAIETITGAPACPPRESKRLPCDLCGTPMEPEHAHYRCPACHYILPCCGW
jgi:Zn finger protein HypA/HybF involved in hydrogenase expression